jgi:hypothetical protein
MKSEPCYTLGVSISGRAPNVFVANLSRGDTFTYANTDSKQTSACGAASDPPGGTLCWVKATTSDGTKVGWVPVARGTFKNAFCDALGSNTAESLVSNSCIGSTCNVPNMKQGGPYHQGTCISTTDCATAGGGSVPAHCTFTSDADIQCCIKVPCTVPRPYGEDVSGACRSLQVPSQCSTSAGHIFTPNLCPGPSSFQCCSRRPPGTSGYRGFAAGLINFT